MDERIFEEEFATDELELLNLIEQEFPTLAFKTDEEAIEWGKTQNVSKDAYINCKVGDEDVILCQTNLVYEDELWNKSYGAMRFLTSLLPAKKQSDDIAVEEASDIRNEMLRLFEERFNVRILHVFNDF